MSVMLRRFRALRDDLRGATLVQFIAVLPVFVLVFWGSWAVFTVMGAHQTLCEAAYESARWLQVEGPRLPEDTTIYPETWEDYAYNIALTEIYGHKQLRESDFGRSDVYIWPREPRKSPESGDHNENTAEEAIFNVRVTGRIANPILGLLDADDDPEQLGGLELVCQASGFFEGPPYKATESDADNDECRRVNCGRPDRCTPGPPPTATPDPCPNCPTPDPNDYCCPCIPR